MTTESFIGRLARLRGAGHRREAFFRRVASERSRRCGQSQPHSCAAGLYSRRICFHRGRVVPASLKIPLSANFVGRLWVGALSFIATPPYVRWLGVEGYGLVGF